MDLIIQRIDRIRRHNSKAAQMARLEFVDCNLDKCKLCRDGSC